MYLIDDQVSYIKAANEALAIGHVVMALILARTLLADHRIPGDIDLPDLDDHIEELDAEAETRLKCLAEYEERTGQRADIPHANSLRTPR